MRTVKTLGPVAGGFRDPLEVAAGLAPIDAVCRLGFMIAKRAQIEGEVAFAAGTPRGPSALAAVVVGHFPPFGLEAFIWKSRASTRSTFLHPVNATEAKPFQIRPPVFVGTIPVGTSWRKKPFIMRKHALARHHRNFRRDVGTPRPGLTPKQTVSG
jgi:hypothetical protein